MSQIQKICPRCHQPHSKRGKYCSAQCYHLTPMTEETKHKMSQASRGKLKSLEHCRNISKGTRGKPKPWVRGERNPNYGNKAQAQPDAYARFRTAVKIRGQVWTEAERKRHRKRMLGVSNAMRGKTHSAETRAVISATKLWQYQNGLVRFRKSHTSKPEFEIKDFLKNQGIPFHHQYHIPGVPYIYDFCFPDLKLILEYQGDYWHCNPLKFRKGDKVKIQGKGIVLVEDIWNRDSRKKEAAVQQGYRVVYVWESEYKKQGVTLIKGLLT